MAVLANADYTDLKKRIRRDPASEAEFRGWGLSKATWMAMFQTIEDWFVNGFTVQPTNSFKDEIETETGPCSNAQAKQAGYVWMGWRYARNP